MNQNEILSHVDHTVLGQQATKADIIKLCDEGIQYGVASVCIAPSYVKEAAEYLAGRLPVCTVIGFPNGYQTTKTKCFETKDAIENGADEIDMVINIGWLKDGRDQDVLGEIKAVRDCCQGHILKVIIETCLLTDDEKIRMCEIVTESGADYIKTSTGFSKVGATFEDIELFAAHIGENVKMKAAGGIKDFADAERFLALGADRLGTSRLVRILSQQ